MNASPIAPESVMEQLEKILESASFENAGRAKSLLRFVVEQSLAGQGDRLKEYTIGVEALERGDTFDPRTDPIVRAEASRLRSRLERYYLSEGRADPVEILLPKGGYAPLFVQRHSEIAVPAAPAPEKPGNTRFAWLAIGILAGALCAGAAFWIARRNSRPSGSPLVQFNVELKAKGEVSSEVGTDVVISPDGMRLVYASLDATGVWRLNTRRLDQPEPAELPGTEGARGPFFSPDGSWVGFWSNGKLKKTPVEGGVPVILCDAGDLLGASWGDDGNIIAALGISALSRVSASGGQPSVILDLEKESVRPQWPQFLQGGKVVVYTVLGFTGAVGGRIEALTLATGRRTILVKGATYGRYLPNGYLAYVNQGTLFAVPFDLATLEARGTPSPVLSGVSYSPTFGFAQFAFSQTGALVYRKSIGGGEVHAEWLDGAGHDRTLPLRPGSYVWPRLSPDGKRLALSVTESGASSIWIYELGTDRTTRIPASAGKSLLPLWSPDGRFLILGTTAGMSWARSDGLGAIEPLIKNTNVDAPWSFTPDGTRLAYHETNPATNFDLWTASVKTLGNKLIAENPQVLLNSKAYETYPAISPDGHWIAYASNESLTWEVYVRRFPDDGTKVQISGGGARVPLWSPNRRELFYRTDSQRIMVATYSVKSGAFTVESVREWSHRQLAETGVLANYDVSPDGEQVLALFAAARPEDQQTGNHAIFVLNFFDEVKRKTTPAH